MILTFLIQHLILNVVYFYLYSTGQEFRHITIFNVFERSLLCSSSLDLFDQQYREKQ